MTETQAQVVDGELNGPFVQRDENGRLRLQASFMGGLLEGPMQILGADGQIEREMNFHQGQLHGRVTIHEPGKPLNIMQFENGEHVTDSSETHGHKAQATSWIEKLKRRFWR